MMKKIVKLAVAAVLTTASITASAWRDYGPWNGVGESWGMNRSDSAPISSPVSRRQGHGFPYYAYYPYAVYPTPLAPVAAPMTEKQQQAITEQQAQAVEAQRKFAEQMAVAYRNQIPAPFGHDFAPLPPLGPDHAAMDAHHEEILKQMEEHHQMMVPPQPGFNTQPPTNISFTEIQAERDQIHRQMLERRNSLAMRRRPMDVSYPQIQAERDKMRKEMLERRNSFAPMGRPADLSYPDIQAEREKMREQMRERRDSYYAAMGAPAGFNYPDIRAGRDKMRNEMSARRNRVASMSQPTGVKEVQAEQEVIPSQMKEQATPVTPGSSADMQKRLDETQKQMEPGHAGVVTPIRPSNQTLAAGNAHHEEMRKEMLKRREIMMQQVEKQRKIAQDKH